MIWQIKLAPTVLFSLAMSFFQSTFCSRRELLDALQSTHSAPTMKCVDLPNYTVYAREEYKYHLKCLVFEQRKKGKPEVMGKRDKGLNIPH